MSTPASMWPGGARIVVALTFLVESWSEGKAPPYSPMTSPPSPARRTWPASPGRNTARGPVPTG